MKYLPLALVLVALGVGTYLEGNYSERWGRIRTERLKQFAARLDELPMQYGDWQGVRQEPDERAEEEFKASNCEKCWSVTFTNQDGQTVNCYVVCGLARHVTIHTPDWCYVGAGYQLMDDPQRYQAKQVTEATDVNNQPTVPEFLTAVFRKEDPLRSHHLRIFWTFAHDGNWVGPTQAKTDFAGMPALYKIYLITDLDGLSGDVESNPALNFSQQFFPTANKVLFRTEDTQTE